MRENIQQAVEHRAFTAVFLLVVAVAVAGSISATSFFSSSESGQLAAEYRFDKGAGDTVVDAAGDNDLAVNGADWTSGVEGKALSFDGSSSATGSLDVDTSEITLSFWMREDGTTDNWSDFVNIDGSNGRITPEYANGNIHMVIRQNGDNYDAPQTSVENGWNHYTLVLSSSRGIRRTYKNGELIGEHTEWPGFQSNQITLGSGTTSSLDAVKVYTQALNRSYVKTLYNQGSWRVGNDGVSEEPSQILDISFQEENATHVFDTSGQNNHGIKMGGVTQEPALNCKLGRCHSFDGNDDYLEIQVPEYPSDDSRNDSSNPVTIMAWIKTDVGSQDSAIAGRFDSGGSHWEDWGSGLKYVDGEIAVMGRNGYMDTNNPLLTHNVTEGEWHHITGVTRTDEGRLYVDGKLVESGDLSAGYSYDFCIAAQCNDGESHHFEGEIDQVKIFNRGLSQREIIEETQGLHDLSTVLDLRFDQNGGDKVYDYSERDNHGTLQPNESAGPSWVDGLTGNALEFDGYKGSNMVEVEEPYTNLETGYSLSFWIYFRDGVRYGTDPGDWAGIYSGLNGVENNRLYLKSDEALIDLVIEGNESRHTPNFPSIKNRWAHFVVRYDGNHLKLFVDGNEEFSKELSGKLDEGSSRFLLGYQNTTYWLDGLLEDVRMYPYAISKSKIDRLYEQGKSRVGSSSGSSSTGLQKGLVLSQTFDHVETCGGSDTVSCPSGMNGEVAVDESGRANHGEIVSDPVERGAGSCKVSKCLGFEGDDKVVMDGNLGFNGTPNYTVSFWSKPESYSGNYNRLVSTEDSDRAGWSVLRASNANTLSYERRADDGSWEGAVGISYTPDEWTHFVYHFVNDTAYGYRNGELVNAASVGTIGNTNSSLAIGARPEAGSHWDSPVDEFRIYNRSLSNQEVWSLYTKGRDHSAGRMAGPAAYYPVQTESSPLRDVSGEGNSGDLNLLGEAGTFNTSDGEWKTVRFERSYADPVVVGTTNTHNGEPALSFEAKNVRSNRAEMRVCESEAGQAEGCDTHGTERVGYMVINANATEDIPGIEAGSFEIDGNLDFNTNTVSYSESFSSAPVVMANVNSDNGNNPVEARVTSYSNSSFTAGICYQNSLNGCEDHPFEEVGWVAVEPGNVPFEQHFEVGSTGTVVGNSNWEPQSFSTAFSETPVVTATTLSVNGAQGLLIDEVRNVDTSGAEVRYCEAENGDSCNGHNNEDVGWFAAEKGLLTYSNGNFPRYVDTERGKALEFDGVDDYVRIPDSSTLSGGPDATITASTWFKTPSSSNTQRILEKQWGAGNGDWGMMVRDSELEYYSENIDGVQDYTLDGGDVEPGKWHNGAFVLNQPENSLKLYLDGRLVAEDSSTGLISRDTSGNVYIGAMVYNNQNPQAYFNGTIDDVRIYPYALGREQIQTVMNNGGVSVNG
ncbi:LamG domain-containing protein [Candidatus Nanohalococcus occultus]|uniref:LamG domain-containing protein n=1 Tax=Candidatus Nanohalococcus occultus TaxID=2978047 RepID=A0ABY8CF26_9ARCH|nr:LamG domain-containing protein [Candidatus Nanohaloarchaeota archaeon SVXNc]